MRIVRTVIWVVLLVALILFSMNNWTTVTIKIWEGLLWETKLPAVVILSFALGFVPVWLVHLIERWRLRRRINTLQAIARQPSAALTTTQLDAASQSAETPGEAADGHD
jgi:uncharacterized integral membrane protein